MDFFSGLFGGARVGNVALLPQPRPNQQWPADFDRGEYLD